MPDSLPLVQLQLLIPFLNGLRSCGVDPEPVLESVGLTQAAVDQEGASVHVMVIHQFVENCAKAAGDKTFGAKIGSQLDPSGWPMIRMAIEQATTLGDFLNIYVAQVNKFASSVTPYVEVRGSTTSFGEIRKFKPLIEPAQNDGFMIALMLSMLERAMGDQMDPQRIILVVSDPSVLHSRFAPFQTLRGKNMGSRIQFPSEWLSVPVSGDRAPTEVSGQPTETRQDPFLTGFQNLLMQHIGHGGLTVGQAANLAHLNTRKLSRQLSKFGTNMSRELTRAKINYAKETLQYSERSIEEITGALGYSDPSNFARAFSKEVGISPSQFRKNEKSTDLPVPSSRATSK